MKNLFKFLISGLMVVSLVFCISCSSDDDGGDDGGGGDDPNSFCTGGLCSSGPNPAAAKAECIDTYNDCMALPDPTSSECRATALTVCNL